MAVEFDKKALAQFKRQLEKLESKQISVGWFPENKYSQSNDNLQMAQNAQWQEEGVASQNIPPRPFMRVGFIGALKSGANKDDFKKIIKAALDGNAVLTALNSALNPLEQTLRKVMLAWNTPPNAPMTIELKGFNDPLVETSELVANVTAKVESKGNK